MEPSSGDDGGVSSLGRRESTPVGFMRAAALPNQPCAHEKHVMWPHWRQGIDRPDTGLLQIAHTLLFGGLVAESEFEVEVELHKALFMQCQPIGIPFFSIAPSGSPQRGQQRWIRRTRELKSLRLEGMDFRGERSRNGVV